MPRPVELDLLFNKDLYQAVVLDKLAHARESVLIATANVKDMQVERGGKFASVLALFSELSARGFGPQLLAAVFKFEGKALPVYWIYGYKRGAFWPFVPTGKEQERDNAEELELKAKLERELPIEPDLSRWFGVFDAPL